MNDFLTSGDEALDLHAEQAVEPALPQALPCHRPVILVGMMGAGKTTIGRALARLVNREFVDLDHVLEARCGVRVSLIFDIEGEEGFRKRETLALEQCSLRQEIVLATGGGAVLAEQNRAYLRQRGIVVYLRASADELYKRVARDRSRPLLQTADPRGRLEELLQQRAPLYEEVADLVFDTGPAPVAQAARALIPLLQQYKEPS